MPIVNKPTVKPQRPFFSSGPTVKPLSWNPQIFDSDLIGRSHRSQVGVNAIKGVLDKIKKLAHIPHDYELALIPGSTTGAFGCAMWNFLGARGVDVLTWDLFGTFWANEIRDQLKIQDLRIFETTYGQTPDLSVYNPDRDTVFVWNGTTTGVCVPNADWIDSGRKGLTICDATSAVFGVKLDWEKLDVTAFSWQKVLGSEAGIGVLVLSPRALQRLKTYTPSWPIPRVFTLKENNEIKNELFAGSTINTVSLLSVIDCTSALKWAENLGGLDFLIGKVNENFKVLKDWVDNTPWVDFVVQDERFCSKLSVCLQVDVPSSYSNDPWNLVKQICHLLSNEQVAFDIKGHRLSFPSLRLWCGPTVEADDIQKALPWIEWAYKTSIG